MSSSGLHGKYYLLLTVLASFFVFFSCGRNDSERNKLRVALYNHYRDDIIKSCTFTLETFPNLFAKQEFRWFQNKEICEGRVVIDTVRHLETDKVQAEIHFVFQANERTLRNLMKAWGALEKRYRTLKPELLPHGSGRSAYVYVDPSDGDIFVSGQDKPGDIFQTARWQHLEKLKTFFTSRLNEREWRTDVLTATLIRENGSWKILNEQGDKREQNPQPPQ